MIVNWILLLPRTTCLFATFLITSIGLCGGGPESVRGVGGVGGGVVVGGGAQSGAMVMVWAWVAVRPVESTNFIVKL